MDKWLRNNNVVKIIALLIGIMLWVVVHMDVNSTSAVPASDVRTDTINNVIVTPMNNYDTNAYSVVSIEPAEVTVILKGKTSSLRKLNPASYKYQIDISKLGAGTHMVPVITDNVPSSVSVEVIPQTVRVTIEEMQKKEVPVVMSVTGTPAAGYKAGQPIVKPGRVLVTMPKSRLDDVEVVRGEINIDKASSAVSKQVKLTAFDKNGKEMDAAVSPPIVDVEVPITSPFKTMPLQVKVAGQPAGGYAVDSMIQKPDQITVYGPQDVLDKLDFYNMPGLQVDISGLKEDKTFTLDIPLMDKLTLVDSTKVDVSFKIVPSVTKTLDHIPITIVGENDGSDTKFVSPEDGTTSVELEGAPSLLDKLKLTDVQAFVDVSNLPPGQHDVNIVVNLPAFVKRTGPSILKATVDIAQKSAAQTSPSPTSAVAP